MDTNVFLQINRDTVQYIFVLRTIKSVKILMFLNKLFKLTASKTPGTRYENLFSCFQSLLFYFPL